MPSPSYLPGLQVLIALQSARFLAGPEPFVAPNLWDFGDNLTYMLSTI